MKNADEPAFPFIGSAGAIDKEGLTKREYFAAHAPEMPEWFNVSKPAKSLEHLPQYTVQYQGQLLRAWRYYYADMMLAEEPAEGGKG